MSNKLVTQTKYNYIIKVLIFLVGFLNVRITVDYLGNEIYGLWATMISIINWINISDFGISNGIRNKITQNMTVKNYNETKSIISSGYYIMSIISIIVLLLTLIILNILNKVIKLDSRIIIPFYISIVGFSINFILNISRSISYALHKSYLVLVCQLLTSVFTVIGTIIISRFTNSNLILYSINSFLALLISNIIITILIFKENKEIIPNKHYINKKYFKDIASGGFKFFIIQICMIILFSTDNLIISNFLGNEYVTKYSNISKIYDSINSLSSIVLVSFWALVSEAVSNNDAIWIIKTKNKLLKLNIILSSGVIIISIFLNLIMKIWLGNNSFKYSSNEIIIFALYSIVLLISSIYVNIANGMHKLDLQMILSIIGAIINIPLSIIFSKKLGMGIAGVKLATLIAIILNLIFIPMQVKKELKIMETKTNE